VELGARSCLAIAPGGRRCERALGAVIGLVAGALVLVAAPARAQDRPPASGGIVEQPPSTVDPSALPTMPPPPTSTQAPPPNSTTTAQLEAARPPPLHVDFLQYGVALTINTTLSPGGVCGSNVMSKSSPPPCILGSGGGLAIRGGYRPAGPWYIGGAYEFTKMDSANLYRLGIFQQARFEMRYLADLGYRATPFATWGGGGLLYGNEWGAETGGVLVFAGAGIELEVSRTAVVGITGVYRPSVIFGWTDTAGIIRPAGVAQFLGIELRLEVRTELNRH
jgi:hypothetical protein